MYYSSYTIKSKDRINIIRNTTIELCNVIKENPDKFLGFCNIPLNLSYLEMSDWIEKYAIQNKLKGIGELSPSTIEQAKLLDNVFKAASDYSHFPLWIHTFNPVSLTEIKYLMELSIKYPNTPVIFGHFGGTNWMDVIEFAKKHNNIYLDLSAMYTTFAPKIAMQELPEKCLYSSDAPYGDPLLSKQMIEALSPSKQIASLVLSENICNILDI